ncbi:4,5-dihydroxyphthalate decarboxylase [Rhizobiales bacterium GAS113]|nr:4,5-dihydroxyphthalate decarboxylase [Rhizobiales bacterium GAS113]
MTKPGETTLARANVPVLKVALATYPGTKALKEHGTSFGAFAVEFAEIAPISRAFAPMVRELRFDISEMALVTFLQAKAYGKPLVLLPVAVAARFQEPALLCRTDDKTISGPTGLVGRRVGVRAYSQTTGVWMRGILHDDYGITPDQIRWLTFEGAHVAEYADPPWVERVAQGKDMLAMLRAGELDAVILGNDRPDDKGLRTVFADTDAAAERFRTKHGFVPVNHMVVARRSLIDARPDLVAGFLDSLRASLTAATLGAERGTALLVGRDALQPAIDLALRYAAEQGLLPHPLKPEEVWDGLPPSILSMGRKA